MELKFKIVVISCGEEAGTGRCSLTGARGNLLGCHRSDVLWVRVVKPDT